MSKSIRISDDLHAELTAYAESNGHSVSGLMAYIWRDWNEVSERLRKVAIEYEVFKRTSAIRAGELIAEHRHLFEADPGLEGQIFSSLDEEQRALARSVAADRP